MFLAIKTEDGRIKGKISFYCKILKVSRQAFNNYLKTKDAQHEDGWIGCELHGRRGQGIDSSISYLLSRGVEKDYPAMLKAVNALLNIGGDKPYKNYI